MWQSYAEIVQAAHAEERRFVEVERLGDRAVLRMVDADKLNVLSAPLMVQLLEQAEQLARDPDIRAIVITGAGRAFSAGGDLRMMQDAVDGFADPADTEGATSPWQWMRYQFGAMVRLIGRTDKAFIAALNGPAAGVGLAFALSCDIAIAAENALIIPGFGKLGLVPEVGTSWALTRALGYRQAFAYYVGGQHIDAHRAAELGLVNEVVPDEELIRPSTVLVRPHLRAATTRIGDRQAAAAQQCRPALGAVTDHGGVQRADVHHHPRLRRGHRQCSH